MASSTPLDNVPIDVVPRTEMAGASATAASSLDRKETRTSHTGTASSTESVAKSAGVLKMEAIAAVGFTPEGRWQLYLIAFLVFAMYWMYCQQSSTTYSFSVFATSSFASHSSGLATMSIATGIIGSVILPFLAKMADVFSRPWLGVVGLVGYVIGFIMILKSPNLATYIVGNVFVSVGTAGLTSLSNFLCADLVPLKWRGMSQGLLSSSYIIVPWYSAHIVSALSTEDKWRWGYGMYAIIMPVTMGPAIALLFWLQHNAVKKGVIADIVAHKAEEGKKVAALTPDVPLGERLILIWHELDGWGLLLLGFGWSLILLPFSLYSGAKGGYNNPSLIAMFVVGALCLIVYVPYELKWAKFPSAPMRLIKNKTFITAIIIDFIYMLAGYMQSLYLSSYAYIVTDWSVVEWGYYNNTLTMGLCGGGVVAGIILRYTHRYKFLQLIGLSLKIIGYGLLVDKDGVRDTARLVISQTLTGIGGSFSVVGSQVGSQASVPHQDVALAISLLTLWSSIGRGIGDAVAVGVWGHNMPKNLAKFIPTANATEIATMFGDITTIKALDYNDPVRQGAIKAYETTVYPLWAGALGLSFIALIAACFQSNFYLGDTQNAYDNLDAAGNPITGERGEPAKATGWRRVLRFWDL